MTLIFILYGTTQFPSRKPTRIVTLGRVSLQWHLKCLAVLTSIEIYLKQFPEKAGADISLLAILFQGLSLIEVNLCAKFQRCTYQFTIYVPYQNATIGKWGFLAARQRYGMPKIYICSSQDLHPLWTLQIFQDSIIKYSLPILANRRQNN